MKLFSPNDDVKKALRIIRERNEFQWKAVVVWLKECLDENHMIMDMDKELTHDLMVEIRGRNQAVRAMIEAGEETRQNVSKQ